MTEMLPAEDPASVLVPMSAQAYDAFVAEAIAEYAEQNIRSGRWAADTAVARAAAEFATLLPDGLATKDHHLFEIRDPGEGCAVGALWAALVMRDMPPAAFVYDIRVHEPFRRRGHARRALLALEPFVRARGATRIGLHVFAFNLQAQALYASLGYATASLNLLKPLPAEPDAGTGNGGIEDLPTGPALHHLP